MHITAGCCFLIADKPSNRWSCSVHVEAAADVLVVARFPSAFWLASYFRSTSGFHFILQQWLQTFSILAQRPVTFTWQICFLTTRQADRGGSQNSHHSGKFAEIIQKNKSCCVESSFLCLVTAARCWWVLQCAVCLNTWSDKLWKPNPQHSQNSAWAFNPRKQICICVPALVEWIIDYHCHTAYDASRDYGCCRLNKRQIWEFDGTSISGYKGSFSQWAGILRIFLPLLLVTVFYSYYSSQVNCEPAQNVFPYFPIIAALLKKDFHRSHGNPWVHFKLCNYSNKKREMLMSEWRKISQCTPSPQTQLRRRQFLREAARRPPHWRHVQTTLQLARSFIRLPRLALSTPLIT